MSNFLEKMFKLMLKGEEWMQDTGISIENYLTTFLVNQLIFTGFINTNGNHILILLKEI